MSGLGTVTRRAFIATAGGAALLATGLFTTRMVCGERTKSKSAGNQLLDILPHEEATSVGRILLAGKPDWADKTWLEAQLMGNDRSDNLSLRQNPLNLAARVNLQCREDFAHQRIITLDGWVLSRTEAQLCTLHALSEMPV